MRSKNKIRTKPRSKRCFHALFAGLLFLATGCASVFNPYDSEFQCPDTDKGRCVSISEAYEMSVSEKDPRPVNDLARAVPQESNPENGPMGMKYDYLTRKYEKMAALIGKPTTPLVVPPDVVRVLILSYTGDDNQLFGYRYVYFFATEPGWVISSGKEID